VEPGPGGQGPVLRLAMGGFLVTGRIKPPLAFWYIVAQLAGATTAAGFCRVIFPAESVAMTHLGLPLPSPPAQIPLFNGGDDS